MFFLLFSSTSIGLEISKARRAIDPPAGRDDDDDDNGHGGMPGDMDIDAIGRRADPPDEKPAASNNTATTTLKDPPVPPVPVPEPVPTGPPFAAAPAPTAAAAAATAAPKIAAHGKTTAAKTPKKKIKRKTAAECKAAKTVQAAQRRAKDAQDTIRALQKKMNTDTRSMDEDKLASKRKTDEVSEGFYKKREDTEPDKKVAAASTADAKTPVRAARQTCTDTAASNRSGADAKTPVRAADQTKMAAATLPHQQPVAPTQEVVQTPPPVGRMVTRSLSASRTLVIEDTTHVRQDEERPLSPPAVLFQNQNVWSYDNANE